MLLPATSSYEFRFRKKMLVQTTIIILSFERKLL
jgi:hypothetical protein